MKRPRRVCVKPVTSGGLFGWIVVEQTPRESFVDDRRRYGWRVAIYNVLVELVWDCRRRRHLVRAAPRGER